MNQLIKLNSEPRKQNSRFFHLSTIKRRFQRRSSVFRTILLHPITLQTASSPSVGLTRRNTLDPSRTRRSRRLRHQSTIGVWTRVSHMALPVRTSFPRLLVSLIPVLPLSSWPRMPLTGTRTSPERTTIVGLVSLPYQTTSTTNCRACFSMSVAIRLSLLPTHKSGRGH